MGSEIEVGVGKETYVNYDKKDEEKGNISPFPRIIFVIIHFLSPVVIYHFSFPLYIENQEYIHVVIEENSILFATVIFFRDLEACALESADKKRERQYVSFNPL